MIFCFFQSFRILQEPNERYNSFGDWRRFSAAVILPRVFPLMFWVLVFVDDFTIMYHIVVYHLLYKDGITTPFDGGVFTFWATARPVQNPIVVSLHSHVKFPKPKPKSTNIVRKRVRKNRIRKPFLSLL